MVEATLIINTHMNYSVNHADALKNHKRAEMILVNMRYQYWRAHKESSGLQSYTSPTGQVYTRPVRDMHIGGCNYRGCPCRMVLAELRASKTLISNIKIWRDGD